MGRDSPGVDLKFLWNSIIGSFLLGTLRTYLRGVEVLGTLRRCGLHASNTYKNLFRLLHLSNGLLPRTPRLDQATLLALRLLWDLSPLVLEPLPWRSRALLFRLQLTAVV